MNTSGFTLIQTVTALAVISIIATLGTVSYYKMIQKSQIAEASNLIANHQIKLFKSLQEGKCATTPVQGKYGIIQGQGDYSYNNGSSCSSGCELKYQFNSNGVSPKLKGKVITVSLLNNGKVSLVSGATTVPEQYLSGIVTSTSSISGDSCSAKIPTQPTITDGSVSGVEVGGTAPTTPGGSDGSGSTTPGGSDGSGSTTPEGENTDGGDPGGSTDVDVPYEDQIALGDAYCFYDRGGRMEYMGCHIRSLDGKKILGYATSSAFDQHYTQVWKAADNAVKLLRNGGAKPCGASQKKSNCTTVVDYDDEWMYDVAWWTGARKNYSIYTYTKDEEI